MHIALIRHGRTIGNLYKAYVGRSDQPLCAEGIAQLQDKVNNGIYPAVDQVFSSPLRRCVQTAGILYPYQKPYIEKDLVERDFGKYEGMNHEEIIQLPGCSQWGITPESMVFPEGESWDELDHRAKTAFSKVVNVMLEENFRTASVICHGGILMSLLSQYVSSEKQKHEWICEPGCGYLLCVDPATKASQLVRGIGS